MNLNYLQLRQDIIKSAGLNEAVLLAVLHNQYTLYKSYGKLNDGGGFFISHDQIREVSGISWGNTVLDKIKKNIEKQGFIKMFQVSKKPTTYYFQDLYFKLQDKPLIGDCNSKDRTPKRILSIDRTPIGDCNSKDRTPIIETEPLLGDDNTSHKLLLQNIKIENKERVQGENVSNIPTSSAELLPSMTYTYYTVNIIHFNPSIHPIEWTGLNIHNYNSLLSSYKRLNVSIPKPIKRYSCISNAISKAEKEKQFDNFWNI
jgi:hypothetical protein